MTVCAPRTPVAAPGFHADQLAVLKPLMHELAAELGDETLVAWLYTPMALPLARGLEPDGRGLRLHGRAVAVPGRAAGAAAGEEATARSAPTWCSPAAPACIAPSRTAIPTCIASPAAWTPSTSAGVLQRGGDAPRPRTRPAAASASGFFGVIDERLDLSLLERRGGACRNGRS